MKGKKSSKSAQLQMQNLDAKIRQMEEGLRLCPEAQQEVQQRTRQNAFNAIDRLVSLYDYDDDFSTDCVFDSPG